MTKATVPDHIEKRLKAVVSERTQLEKELQKEQDKLRKLAGQPEFSASMEQTPRATQVAKVNKLKADIGRVSLEHAELARTRTLILGGTNYTLPPG
jgi:hypothetical protein